MHVSGLVKLTFDDVEVAGNTALRGAGALIGGGAKLGTRNSIFVGNTAADVARGILCLGGAFVDACSIEVTGNKAALGAGIFASSGCIMHVANSRIAGNAGTEGAGMAADTASNVRFRSSLFEGNNASSVGGAVSFRAHSTPWESERTETTAGGAGSLSMENGIYIASCTLRGNRASAGGGVYATGAGQMFLTQSELQGNTVDAAQAGVAHIASSGSGGGGGVAIDGRVLFVAAQNLFRGNIAAEGGVRRVAKWLKGCLLISGF